MQDGSKLRWPAKLHNTIQITVNGKIQNEKVTKSKWKTKQKEPCCEAHGSWSAPDELPDDAKLLLTENITKQLAKQSASTQLGGGAEVDGFNKTLTSLDINISSQIMMYVILFMSLVLIISLIISSINILRKSPKDLLSDD